MMRGLPILRQSIIHRSGGGIDRFREEKVEPRPL